MLLVIVLSEPVALLTQHSYYNICHTHPRTLRNSYMMYIKLPCYYRTCTGSHPSATTGHVLGRIHAVKQFLRMLLMRDGGSDVSAYLDSVFLFFDPS